MTGGIWVCIITVPGTSMLASTWYAGEPQRVTNTVSWRKQRQEAENRWYYCLCGRADKQHPPLFSLCYPQSRGAADRQLRWPARTGTGAAACEWPRAAPGLATQTPFRDSKDRSITHKARAFTNCSEHLNGFPTTQLCSGVGGLAGKPGTMGNCGSHHLFVFQLEKDTTPTVLQLA